VGREGEGRKKDAREGRRRRRIKNFLIWFVCGQGSPVKGGGKKEKSAHKDTIKT
jgi:hypothetical protein